MGKSKSRLVLLLILLPVILFGTTITLTFLSKASTANVARIYFSPASENLPGNRPVRIMAESLNGNIAFASVAFSFDPDKIRLTSEITTNTLLSNVVQKTSMINANAGGYARIVLSVPPQSTFPSGVFEFASFTIDSASPEFISGTIDFDVSKLQFVNSSTIELTPEIGNLILVSAFPSNIPTAAFSPPPPTVTAFIPTATPWVPTMTRVPSPTAVPSADSVQVYFGPNPLYLSSGGQVRLLIDSGSKQTAFVRLTMTFDNTQVLLGSEISTNPIFGNVISKTSMADANASGSITLVLATEAANYPGGKFEAANFTVKGLKNNVKPTSLDIDPVSVLILNGASAELRGVITNLGINGPGNPAGYTSPTPRARGKRCKSPFDAPCLKPWAQEYVRSLTSN